MKNKQNRRNFIKSTAVGTGAVMATPYFNWNEKVFANQDKNDRPNIGCIGVGSMGSGDARGHNQFGNIVAVCDVDQNHANRAKND
ncbi:MAG: twin-arginine translocation signal domain-containing protein, partial [Planctomycetota bacterium]|nr:twin-arginine translocation signal domain-containing protein [Planctomycetota bacterium]